MAVLVAFFLDTKSIEKKTGQKVSLKRNFEFFVGVYKEMFAVLTLRRWRERRREANNQVDEKSNP